MLHMTLAISVIYVLSAIISAPIEKVNRSTPNTVNNTTNSYILKVEVILFRIILM